MCSKRKEKKKERKKVNNQRLEKSKRKKIEKKEKEYEKGSWDQTMSEQMCRIVESKKERKSNNNNDLVKTRGMHEAITFLVTNQILFSLLLRGEPKRKKKKQNRQRPKHPKAKVPTKLQLSKKSY